VFAAAWWLLRRLRGRDADGGAVGPNAPDPAAEQMVVCSHCGLHVPQQEAVAADDKYYCCAEHRRRAP
jgi:hypothetical protein